MLIAASKLRVNEEMSGLCLGVAETAGDAQVGPGCELGGG